MIFHVKDSNSNNYKTLQKEIGTFCKEQSFSAKAHMTLTSIIFEVCVENENKNTVSLEDILVRIKRRYANAESDAAKEHYEYMTFKIERALQIK